MTLISPPAFVSPCLWVLQSVLLLHHRNKNICLQIGRVILSNKIGSEKAFYGHMMAGQEKCHSFLMPIF